MHITYYDFFSIQYITVSTKSDAMIWIELAAVVSDDVLFG
jgi:hypothetical protein